MGMPRKLLCLLLVLLSSIQIDSNRSKRMFALCPPHFLRIGNECYFISQNRVNWLDAHFECKDRNSHLAEPYRQEDRFLRKYLNRLQQSRPADVWLGARFNWERNKWQWGHNGKDLTYQSFSQMSADNKDLKFHCAIMKPELKYRWSASSCEQQHQYICQHRMPYVSEKNRQKIYSKWNETYPNEMANEIEVVLSEDDLSRRRRRLHRTQMRAAQMNNRQAKDGLNRQRNDIHFANTPNRDQLKYPTRKVRMGGNRQRNNRRHNGGQFELNRNRASGVRQRIQFNNTNSTRSRQFNVRNQNRMGRQRQRFNHPNRFPTTISPTVWPSTAWSYPTTMKPIAMTRPTTTAPTTAPSPPPSPSPPVATEPITFAPPNVISNEVTQYNDNQYRQQQEDAERLRQEERLRQKEAEHLWRMEQERLKEMRRHDLEKQRHDAMERDRARENEVIQNERKQQEHRRQHEHANARDRMQQQPNMHTDPIRQQNERINDEHAVQTNEVFRVPTSTLSPQEEKKLKRKLIRERLSKLSPEEQQLFFARRAQNRKIKREH